ncbi:hypothetical protein PtB15_6B742 [Puccinia triticina]|nr:hypothetical protein PtB15_6B742 [Puccinia triticina]
MSLADLSLHHTLTQLDRLLLRPSPMKSEELSPRTSQPSGSHPQPEKPPPEKPQAEEDSLESRIQPYMAIRLVEQIKNTHPPGGFLNPFSASDPAPTAASKQPILASPHPHRPPTPAPTRPNIGLTINSSFPPQELAISTGQPNPEILYTAEPPPHVLPITLFPSAMLFAPGNRVAVDGFISYATKAGRIRVIDQNSGARMLLRKHDGPVIDIAGSDGRLVLWKVPVRFDEDSASYEVLAEVCAVDSHLLRGPEKDLPLAPRPARFVALSAHPLDPSIFLLSTNDHRLILVRLDRGAFAPAWKRGTPLPKALSELEAFEGQDVLRTSSDVVAFAFSPDGSAFAFVTEDKILTVRQTSKPHWTIMGGQLPASPGGISRLEFLARAGGPIKGFLITKRSGTRVEAVQLSEISEVVIGISLHPPESPAAQALPCFGHSAWQPQYSTILLSNSLRGSIFTFHLNFCDPVDDEPGLLPDLPPITTTTTTTTTTTKASRLGTSSVDDDASYIERVAASRQSPDMQRSRSNSWIAARTMFVDQISELPSPDPIISFVLDQGSRPPPGPSSSPVSVFNLHPKGIHQLYLPKDLLDFHPSKNCLPDTPAAHSAAPPVRSRSLAGEILVDVHFLGPEPEAVVRKTQMKEIVDELGRTISAQLEQTVAEMRRTQQAEAAGREKVVAELVEEVRQLRAERGAEQGQFERVLDALHLLGERVEAMGERGPAVPVAAPPSSSPARGPPEAGPRPETPDYEELSRLSQPVLLTLAHHLCQDLLPDPAAPQPAPLGVFGLARLRWTWAALAALDELDQQTAQLWVVHDKVLRFRAGRVPGA